MITKMIREYGIHKLPVKNMVYLHCLKARDDEPIIIPFRENLKYNKLEEVDI